MTLKPLVACALVFCALPAVAQDNFTNGVNISDADLGSADLFVSDNTSLRGDLCVGGNCADNESFALQDAIKIEDVQLDILFEDVSGGGFPSTDWRLKINTGVSLFGGGENKFALENVTAGSFPFTVMGSAPNNALYVTNGAGSSPLIGLGTSLPSDAIHIVSNFPSIRFENNDSAQIWTIEADDLEFLIANRDAGTDLFSISRSAPEFSFYIDSSGDVGLGIDNPEGKLHTYGEGVQLTYFESSDGGPVQVRFRTDSENRRFLAVDNDNNVKSQIIFLDDRINFTGQTDSGANLWLSIGPNGITSQGPTCGSPCDLTFDPEVFTVPSVAERAEYMWTNMHLPAIGPTSPDEPFNLTEKMGGVIHELEVAHIYIEELHTELTTLRRRDAQREVQIKWLTEKLLELDAR